MTDNNVAVYYQLKNCFTTHYNIINYKTFRYDIK